MMGALAAETESIARTAPGGRESGRVLMRGRGLRQAFGGQSVLAGVDFELREGEVVLLRGENGSGKTTLLNILTGNLEPDAGEIQLFANGGRPELFRFPRRWWQELNPWDHFTPERVAVEGVGRTWQDVRLFGSQSLVDNLCVATMDQIGEHPWEVLTKGRRLRSSERRNRESALGLLRDVGLESRGDSSADMISLGQSKRVAVARATRARARILFLDEPLAGLDDAGVSEVLAMLEHLASEHRLTLVIVEHVFNIPLILGIASRVWTLTGGMLEEESIDKAQGDSVKLGKSGGLVAWLRKEMCDVGSVAEESLPRGAVLTRFRLLDRPVKPLLEVNNLVAYRGHRLVLGENESGRVEGINLHVHCGELVLLQAPNGWGKTSLVEALAGVLPVASGTVRLAGRTLDRLPPWERVAAGLAVQRAHGTVFPNLTVDEQLRLAHSGALSSNNSGLLHRTMGSLSGGERQRVVLESTRNHITTMAVWDEPFGSLDEGGALETMKHILPTPDSAAIVLMPSSHRTDWRQQ